MKSPKAQSLKTFVAKYANVQPKTQGNAIESIFCVEIFCVKLFVSVIYGMSFKVTHNEQGLAMWWYQNYVCPQLKPNDCNIADVLFISQIYNVKPELKYNKEQNVEAIFVKPQ